MFGAVDAGLILQVADQEQKEKDLLNKTEDGRAILKKREEARNAYDAIPEGAQAYDLVKLARHQNPENHNPAPVRIGTGGQGYVRVFTNQLIKHNSGHGVDEAPDFDGIAWECQKTARPKINSVFMVAGEGNWLRTSLVRSYYVHDDPEGYAEHPDKLVLPEGFPMKAALGLPQLEVGDMVICTMNSLYLCRAMPGVTYNKPVEKEETAA